MQQPKSGPNHVGEYQVSGLPYAMTGSGTTKVEFPYLTQWILLKSTGTSYKAGFSAEGVITNYCFTVPVSGTVGPLNLRIKDLFLNGTGPWEVVAGLTMVERRMFPVLSAAYAPGTQGAYSSSIGFGYTPGL